MATWNVQITVKDIVRKEASIAATRTDGEDVRTYRVSSAILDTTAQKLAVLDNLWSQFQADEARRTAIGLIVGAMETDAAANLNARET